MKILIFSQTPCPNWVSALTKKGLGVEVTTTLPVSDSQKWVGVDILLILSDSWIPFSAIIKSNPRLKVVVARSNTQIPRDRLFVEGAIQVLDSLNPQDFLDELDFVLHSQTARTIEQPRSKTIGYVIAFIVAILVFILAIWTFGALSNATVYGADQQITVTVIAKHDQCPTLVDVPCIDVRTDSGEAKTFQFIRIPTRSMKNDPLNMYRDIIVGKQYLLSVTTGLSIVPAVTDYK